jgi:hypothetical protein
MPKRAVALAAALLTANPLSSPEPPEPAPEPKVTPDLDEQLAELVPPARPAQAAPPQPLVAAPAPKPAVFTSTVNRPKTPRVRKRIGGGDFLARIRQCESGGDYSARSASGRYAGAYQFDRKTFASVGGSGDPAAAPPAEQDYRARLLYQRRGGRAWPVCASRA